MNLGTNTTDLGTMNLGTNTTDLGTNTNTTDLATKRWCNDATICCPKETTMRWGDELLSERKTAQRAVVQTKRRHDKLCGAMVA
uniref:Uncharacterized protein n=1 Tax=Cucumis melo TaxID=3656 RepID=A0A9I9DD74_CUCME